MDKDKLLATLNDGRDMKAIVAKVTKPNGDITIKATTLPETETYLSLRAYEEKLLAYFNSSGEQYTDLNILSIASSAIYL